MRSEALLQLGKKIIDELGTEPRVDTLACWMAHYIAELIQAAETATEEERPAKLKQCCDAILDLWQHRREFPNGRPPFQDFEPILKALESLDPSEEGRRYFRTAWLEADRTEQSAACKKWFEIASALDYSARMLIRYCLVRAVEGDVSRSREWIALAEAAGLEDCEELPVIRVVVGESDLLNAPDPDDTERKTIEDRITRLEAFTSMATDLLADLRKQLLAAGAPGGVPSNQSVPRVS